ncbi:MAG: PIN domain-containing protein [Methanothrix sp.]|jgi:predicted nucleic acid-binding protein|nr:PIN domain-containing protein [Methanothrix sp.]
MDRLFADTYALVELLKGNPNYKCYSNVDLVATEFNILELTYALFRDFGRDEAANVIGTVRAKIVVIPTDDSDYLNASDFRSSANRTGKKLSLVDALGYSCSRKLGIKFLTGDKEFSEMENVEYAK